MSITSAGPDSATERESGLERDLSPWQQGMIAIGGTVGVGLFLGSGATIGLAGPAVVVTYLLAAIPALAMGFVLAEMSTVHPVAGSFGVYADLYLGGWAGFAARLTYWFAETLAIGAQVTAVGVYFGFWFPEVPSFVFMALAALLAVTLNAFHVGRFGFLESTFSTVKVCAIVAFILTGTTLALGLGPHPAVGLHHLYDDGGFFPKGVEGVWLASTLVLTSFLGVEAVAVTAGEAQDPSKMPRALLGTVTALIALYVFAMLVIVSVSPWRAISETGGNLTGSPFVKVFADAGVPFAGTLMNFVVISAALTAVVSHLYLGSRMLFSLSRAGYVPAALGALDRRGVPLRALFGTTLGMIVAVVLAARGEQIFLPMFGTAVAALLSIWIAIFLCHLRFRRRISSEALRALAVRVPGHPVPALAGIALILTALAATPWVSGLEWTVPMFLLWLAAVSVVYSARSRRSRATRAPLSPGASPFP